MDYPVWDVGVGYGILMAVFGVVHVFISHFAIGGGLYLVWAERAARRAGDAGHLDFLRRLSGFFATTTLIFGALTGVGIWFVIGLLSPAGTEVLIRNFVWGWAVEWTFFLVEILAAILYARGWDRLSPKAHEALGWVYFAAAWLSLVVINGIVTFMLTPGRWITTGSFWDGFWNPTYLSSLVLRTAICVLMAGLFTLAVAARLPASDLRGRLVRRNALWGLLGLVAAAGAFVWYRADIPEPVLAALGRRLTIPATSLRVFHVLTAVLAVGLVVAGLALPRAPHRATSVVLLLAGLGWFGAYEWFRESLRKPYVVTGYMYANGVEVARAAGYAQTGSLPAMGVRTGDDGRDLWLRNCRPCHTMDGYNPVAQAFDNTDPQFVAGVLRGLDTLRGKMPPFAGNAAEREALAAWIFERVDRRKIHERHALQGVALGKKVYEARCGPCHVEGGWKDNRSSLSGFSAEELDEFLSEPLTDEMPVFSGDDVERKALIEYLLARSMEVPK